MKTIYLDYAATTPIDPRVAAKMADYLTQTGCFGNPASLHVYGQEARAAVEEAREQVASFLHAEPGEILWTSGATESINLALKGAAHLYQRKGKHIVTMKTEHKAVLDTCQHLEKEGYSVTYLLPDTNGLLNLETFQSALRDDTILASIMQVNNETGVIQNIDAIAAMTSARGILLHVDATQSPGKVTLDVTKTPADLISFGAHKAYGPKGIGALYLRKKPRVRVEPLIHGGGHEQGMRSGTLPTHQIVGMGEALSLAILEKEKDIQHISALKKYFLDSLFSLPESSALFKKIILNAAHSEVVPHIINLRFEGMIADAILASMPMIAASTASACQGKGTEGSYVLRAMGLTSEQIKSSVRFSIGRFTTQNDIEICLQQIKAL